MEAAFLQDLRSGWHVDQAILSESERIVIIRFGIPGTRECLLMDEKLAKMAPLVSRFAAVYTCDINTVTDFNDMYELREPCTIMFFYRNKHVMCDFGTGNNNQLDFVIEDVQELVDIVETIYRGAIKGRGLVIAPKDYSYLRRGRDD
ncbi:hypothetical protein CANINC_001409 [Pichia inconspicua]|uniref:Spliceosomal protein DIB1 n=1 Tax=Pichia inconspicua TaxID=52247 RepID=A0A4V4NG01_9ASCO|nr:hypothetical protein CANINC_001409 [[Candida] inconspicua]